MPVPSQGELHRPVLEIASKANTPLTTRQFLDPITERYSLTSEDLGEKVAAGLPRIRVNVGWALGKLTHAGLLNRPSRGHFQITVAGRDYLKGHIGKITHADLRDLASKREPGSETSPSIVPHPSSPAGTADDDDSSPQDKMDAAFLEIQDQLAVNLLDTISAISPEGFERMVVNLLENMGYGKGQTVGRSGDGGIDGVLDQDALGLERIYVQAKRWQSQIGELEIRNFIGSLVVAEGASKGVFVTNSTFSASARQTAQITSNKFIRLIDGPELAKLMIDHNVGVISQYTYKIQKLDENYFSDEL